MKEPPDEDSRGNHQHAEGLVSPEYTALFRTPLLFGDLLLVRLDSAFNHSSKPILLFAANPNHFRRSPGS